MLEFDWLMGEAGMKLFLNNIMFARGHFKKNAMVARDYFE